MEKVKVSKEIFDAFESCKNDTDCFHLGYFRDNKWDLDFMLMQKIKSNFEEERSVLNQLSTEYFFNCMIFGYELEETPEEKILKAYNNHRPGESLTDSAYCEGWMNGLKFALKQYQIEIKGIN